MLNFKELPENGQAFEQLVRELIFSLGLHVRWSGRGQDGGRDLICVETLPSVFSVEQKTWLVQCKHFAHADRSVGIGDLDDIVDSCHQHGATGYLLACSTQPSSGVTGRLEGVAANPKNNVTATYWDAVQIERLLEAPSRWAIAQLFFPVSAGEWRIYATEQPNDFVAHYKGYVFHLTNRIGSSSEGHLPSIKSRIHDIESIELPEHHFIRPRCVYFDDKNGGYTWYIDYMYPHDGKPAVSIPEIQHFLGDGWALEDGQSYSWDVKMVSYIGVSDHYDEDHYDYYTRYMPNYLTGRSRSDGRDFHDYYAAKQTIEQLEKQADEQKDRQFNEFLTALRALPFIKMANGSNASAEYLHRFERRRKWNDILGDIGWSGTNFFDVKLTIAVSDETAFHKLLATFPQEIEAHFRLAKAIIYLPGGERSDDDSVFDLTLSVHPAIPNNQWEFRAEMDAYLARLKSAVLSFQP
jgi:hypothetical protein